MHIVAAIGLGLIVISAGVQDYKKVGGVFQLIAAVVTAIVLFVISLLA